MTTPGPHSLEKREVLGEVSGVVARDAGGGQRTVREPDLRETIEHLRQTRGRPLVRDRSLADRDAGEVVAICGGCLRHASAR
jgi:hypothetical protein